MASLFRLFPHTILLFALLTSCAQRQVHSSNEDQFRQLSLEIEAGFTHHSLGNVDLAVKAESPSLVKEPEKQDLKKRESFKSGKKIKEKIHKSVPNSIKLKKLINGIKKKKAVKNNEQKDFIKDNIVLKIGLWMFIIGLIIFLLLFGVVLFQKYIFLSNLGLTVLFVGFLIGAVALILSIPIMLIGLIVSLLKK